MLEDIIKQLIARLTAIEREIARTKVVEYASSGSSSADSGVDRVVETGTTRTIADTYSLVVARYFSVEGSGSLVLEGDAALEVV